MQGQALWGASRGRYPWERLQEAALGKALEQPPSMGRRVAGLQMRRLALSLKGRGAALALAVRHAVQRGGWRRQAVAWRRLPPLLPRLYTCPMRQACPTQQMQLQQCLRCKGRVSSRGRGGWQGKAGACVATRMILSTTTRHRSLGLRTQSNNT